MEDSVFAKIIRGEIPSYKIYEDDKTLAFLDIHPVMFGHVLVVPKIQLDHVDELPEDDYTALFLTVKKVASRIKSVLGSKRSIILVMGYDVPHAHVHVLPSDSSQDFYDAFNDIAAASAAKTDMEALKNLAKRLSF